MPGFKEEPHTDELKFTSHEHCPISNMTEYFTRLFNRKHFKSRAFGAVFS